MRPPSRTDLRDTVSARLDALAGDGQGVAVAVSGGADSMALCLLTREWAARRGKRLAAVTVDHRLRAESAEEARRVENWMRARGIEHRVLAWEHPPLVSAIEEQAREARYRLLTLFCHERGIRHLLVGHHLQDQAETFLLRLESHSGADGLACMAEISERDGIAVVRPLLDARKAELEHYLREQGQDWLHDPSNLDARHSRNRLRALLPALEEQGITAEKLAAAAARYGEMRREMDEAMAFAAARCVELSEGGYAFIDREAFRACPPALAARMLSRLMRTLGGVTPAPRTHEIASLAEAAAGKDFSGATLGGCEFLPLEGRRKGRMLALREWARVEKDVALRGVARWDNRYLARSGKEESPMMLGSLGKQGVEALRRKGRALPALPKKALYALPAIRVLDEIAHAPHIGYRHPGMPEAELVFVPRQAFPGRAFGA